MTIRISLADEESKGQAGPSTPKSTFATPSLDPQDDLRGIVHTLRGAKKVVVISGAGVSTAADIPDFRSARGLFNDNDIETGQNSVRGKGKGRAGDVKDLFHVKCLSNHHTLASHNALITSLASLAHSAAPTPFHSCLSSLAASGRLLRCYTQNIDSLESKVGLSVGIPRPKPKPGRRPKSPRSKSTVKTGSQGPKGSAADLVMVTDAPQQSFDPNLLDPELGASVPSPPPEPENDVIPLHGLLTTLHCGLCLQTVPLLPLLPLPASAIPCPTCQLSSTIRSALSERPRRSGSLRPSVVLYGEEHPQGELIGQVVERDLKTVDCLLVAGTSLSVPGVKRIVKEMSKAIHTRSKSRSKNGGTGKVVYVNDEPPAKVGEWKGIFDIWIEGDIQKFVVDYLANANSRSTSNPATAKEKREREAISNLRNSTSITMPTSTPSTPTKKRKKNDIMLPPTPESLEKPAPKKRRIAPAFNANDRKSNVHLQDEGQAKMANGVQPITPTRERGPTDSRVESSLSTPRSRGRKATQGVPATPLSIDRGQGRQYKDKRLSVDGDEDNQDSEERQREYTPTPMPMSEA